MYAILCPVFISQSRNLLKCLAVCMLDVVSFRLLFSQFFFSSFFFWCFLLVCAVSHFDYFCRESTVKLFFVACICVCVIVEICVIFSGNSFFVCCVFFWNWEIPPLNPILQWMQSTIEIFVTPPLLFKKISAKPKKVGAHSKYRTHRRGGWEGPGHTCNTGNTVNIYHHVPQILRIRYENLNFKLVDVCVCVWWLRKRKRNSAFLFLFLLLFRSPLCHTLFFGVFGVFLYFTFSSHICNKDFLVFSPFLVRLLL